MIHLDRIDFEIIDLLQNNARMSNKEIAAHVNLAPSTCHERLRRLRSQGVFRGFHAEVREDVLGIELQGLIEVRLTEHSRKLVAAFQSYAIGVEEVLAVYHVTGDFDFLLHVAVRNTDHLRDVLLDRFTTRSEVANLRTHIIFDYRRVLELPNYRRGAAERD